MNTARKACAARALVRAAAMLAPANRRPEMILEWDAELEDAFESGGGWAVTWSAMGAFADAWAIRRVTAQRERSVRRRSWLAGVSWDTRVAIRGLRRSPGFTLVAVLTLAVGLGGVVAIYTVVDRVVLDPLPYPDADRLVRLQNRVPGVDPQTVWRLSTAQWVHFTERSRTLDDVGLYLGEQGGMMPGWNLQTESGPYRTRGAAVTASTVRMLGVRPYLGRLIDDGDDQPGTPLVVVLTYEFWSRVLGADPDVVGTQMVGTQPSEVIGVMEPGTELPGWPAAIPIDFWFPMQTNRTGGFSNSHVFPAIARLAPGATVEAAQAELESLNAELPERFPRAYGGGFIEQYGFRTVVAPLKDDVVGTLARDLWILLGGVALVLIIACANVVNLFAVRVEARAREMQIRTALGAGRWAMARYALVEGTALAALGGALAVLVAVWAIPGVTALAPEGVPRLDGVRVGPDGVLLAMMLSLLIGFVLAAHSLLAARSAGAGPELPRGGQGNTTGPRSQRFRSGLVVAQVAFALTLTVGAGLLLQGIRALRDTDVGFQPDGVLAVDLYPDARRYREDTDLWALYRTVQERLGALPGVESVGLGEEVPVTGAYGCTVQGFEDETVYERARAAGVTTCAGEEIVTPGYFEALGIPVLEGRGFEAADVDEPERAGVVVSRAFAERFWPGQDAVGRGVAPGGRTIPPYHHVIGVVGDVPRAAEPGEPPFAEDAMAIYYPVVHNPEVPGNWGRWWPGYTTLLVRTGASDPMTRFSEVRAAIDEIDPEMPLVNARAMETVVRSAMADVAFVSLLFGLAAMVALSLAAVGLYGVVSYVVTCRTKELGLRMAVGARAGQLERMVIAQTMGLVVLGLVLAVPMAFGAVRLAQTVLVGVDVMDPRAYVLSAAVMIFVAVVAGWAPARRAASVDPMRVLRGE